MNDAAPAFSLVIAMRESHSRCMTTTSAAVKDATGTAMTHAEIEKLRAHPAWISIREAATSIQALQSSDGSITEATEHAKARELITHITQGIEELAPLLPHDADYLTAVRSDLHTWANNGFTVPDFLDSLVAFHPELHRVDGLVHLVVFPMYTQNGSSERHLEAVLIQVIWPDFVAALEAGDYTNAAFVPIRFIDFTAGYDTNSAVLFPETVAVRAIPQFTWGGIFADREAARFRKVLAAACEITSLDPPEEARAFLDDQRLTEETFVMWDLIHDRTHMRGDLPFDPFMIKQRMPYFLYSLEELRCDLTAFREALRIERIIAASPDVSDEQRSLARHARLVQYAVIFDRIFRFTVTGGRNRNYDGLGGQLLFAWLHRKGVLHWTDTKLTFDWDRVPDMVNELGDAVNDLYWQSIDRPKVNHWFAAYDLVASVLEPHVASKWATRDLPLNGTPRELTDAVLDDEFPLSMFFEAYEKKVRDVIASTKGITGEAA
ncbi:Uncharacterised protein [Dermatophilus congolensis]|uniref:Uncharacterized protein n=2 Tax=Dermatophilus congolensis TaxID=1863 RepID=A0A239VCR8_9MICO|nr:Uncharacterised protein [Dermatophilus congolensis]